MNRLALVIPMLLLQPAWAAETIHRELAADPAGEVEIEIVRGDVKIIAWDQDKVLVDGVRDEASREFIMERSGKVIHIEDELKHRLRGPRGREGTRITVNVPRQNTVKVSLVSADLAIGGVQGAVRADTVSGNISGRDLGDKTELETVSGDITLEGAGRMVRAESVSGDISLQTASTELHLETVSGGIEAANGAALARGEINTVSGKGFLLTALDGSGDLTLESVSGDLTLGLQGTINARFKVETGPGGHISNKLTADVPDRERYTGAENIEFSVGDGGADIEVSVVSGKVTLGKK